MIKETLDLTKKYDESLYSTRVLVIQTVYTLDVINDVTKLEQSLVDYIDYYDSNFLKKTLNQDYYKNLARFVINSTSKIDHKIKMNAEWKIERLPKVVLSVLRSGVGELNLFPQINKALLINDYLEASKTLNHAEEIGFINSILDKI